MTQITASQLIYSHVEVVDSPTGRSGYQTILRTEDITEDRCREMEPRLNTPGRVLSAKHSFFRLRDGAFVLAQFLPIEGGDRYGREGRHLVHVLVIDVDQFAKVDYNPMLVFRAFSQHFVADLETALSMKTGQGKIDRVTFDVPPGDVDLEILDDVAGASQFRNLTLLAVRAQRYADEHTFVGIQGSTDQVFKLLYGLFGLIPRSLRADCSFDTSYGGSLGRLPYWAIGFQEGTRHPKMILYDIGARTLKGNFETEPTSLFEEWIARLAKADANTLGAIAAQAGEAAYALSRYLSGQDTEVRTLQEAKEELFADFLRMAPDQVRRSVKKDLETMPSADPWDDRLLELAWDELQTNSNDAKFVKSVLVNGFKSSQVDKWQDKLSQRDKKEQADADQRVVNNLLDLGRSRRYTDLARDIRNVEEATYRKVVREFGRYLKFYFDAVIDTRLKINIEFPGDPDYLPLALALISVDPRDVSMKMQNRNMLDRMSPFEVALSKPQKVRLYRLMMIVEEDWGIDTR